MRLALATLTLAPLVALGAPAHADPVGFICGLGGYPSPLDATRTIAEVDAGPLVIAEADGATRTGHLTCTVQLGQRHAAPDTVAVRGPETPDVVAVPPTPVGYDTPAFSYYLCTEVEVDGATLYWDESDDPTVQGGWSTDPATARCSLVVNPNENCDDCEPPAPWQETVDAIVCPYSALLFPPDGDLPFVYGCDGH